MIARIPPSEQRTACAVTVALAALFTLAGYAGPTLLAAVAFAGLILAWGWASALDLPSPRGTTAVLVFAVAAMGAAAGMPGEDPLLRWLPAAGAASIIAAFVHQIARRDGRPRLVESVSSEIFGVAVLACGACLPPLVHVLHGETVVAIGMTGIAVGAVLDLVGRLRWWLVVVSVVPAAVAGVLVGLLADGVDAAASVAVAVPAAVLSQGMRRGFAALPAAPFARNQLVSAAASVLVCGVVVYVAGRVLVA